MGDEIVLEEITPAEVTTTENLELMLAQNHTESMLVMNSINTSINTLNILLVSILVVLTINSTYEFIHHFYDITLGRRR